MSGEPVVWHGAGQTYHATRPCAGQAGVPVWERFVADSRLSPCGVCQPGERYACDDCERVYKKEADLRHHRLKKHASVDETGGAPERVRELDAKARGESDD
jgi:hypothetical protein